MIRLVASIVIAACSLPFLAGCGATSTVAPIARVSKPSSVKQTAKPVATPTGSSGTASRPFATQIGAGSPAFAPKGDKLVMETLNGLAFAAPNGQQVRSVTGSRADDQAPAFSPDGGVVVFIRHNGTRSTALMRLTLATGQIDPMYETTEQIHSVAWAPDGRALVYVADQDAKSTLYRLPVPGNTPAVLWKGAGSTTVTVSATGMVVFDTKGDTGARALARMPIAGGTAQKLGVEGTNPHHPRFSPTGRSLAYVADDGLYVASEAGTGGQRVASGDGFSAVAWNPLVAQMVVAAPRGSRTDLQIIDLPRR